MRKFKVLFLYPNGRMLNPPPISIGIFTAILNSQGIATDLFDTTLYADRETSSDEAKQDNLQVRPFTYGERAIKLKTTSMVDDFAHKVVEFKPDLIAVSILESTYQQACRLLQSIEGCDIPVLAGGVFPTFAHEIVLSNKNIDMVCIGEGEELLPLICNKMKSNGDYTATDNLWIKKDNKIIKNKIGLPIDFNSLPIPDYSLFDAERFFRPMAGKVYKTIPIETNRGCPYSCTFCNSPSMTKLYKDRTSKNYFRKKSIKKIESELRYLINYWGPEYLYFTSDVFLTMTDNEFDKFITIYSEYKIPFWMQSRIETVTEYRMKKLKDVGCHRMSIGLEHGNNEFRKLILKKHFDNDAMIKATKIISDAGIPLTVNNIIGFPDETRDLIFDTIELNRMLDFDTANAAAFTPFHGTSLHEYCIQKKGSFSLQVGNPTLA